jgi:hypothetical protein
VDEDGSRWRVVCQDGYLISGERVARVTDGITLEGPHCVRAATQCEVSRLTHGAGASVSDYGDSPSRVSGPGKRVVESRKDGFPRTTNVCFTAVLVVEHLASLRRCQR